MAIKFLNSQSIDGELTVTDKVGIGTTSPSCTLEVEGPHVSGIGMFLLNGDSHAYMTMDSASNDNSGLFFKEDSVNKWLIDYQSSSNFLRFYSYAGNAGVRMVIEDSTGNVGIGTTNPSEKLVVVGKTLVSDDGADDFIKQSVNGTVSTLAFGNTEGSGGIAKWEYNRTTGSFSGYTGVAAATEFMTVKNTGNVGIGNTNPNAKLYVDGGALGGTALDTVPLLSLKTTTTNADTLQFTSERLSTGTTWESAAHRIQRKVDVTKMGYIQFGSHNDDLITFGENATEYMRIDGSGNVNIINNQLNLTAATTQSSILNLGQGRTGNGYAYIDLIGDPTYFDYGFRIIRANTGANAPSSFDHRGTGDFNIKATEAATIRFLTSASERMRITSAGNVGIGTTSPDSIFHISQGANSTATNLIIENTDTSILDTEDLAKIEFKSNDASSGGVGVAASIRAVAEAAGNRYGLAFNTKLTGTESEKMRVTHAGNVGIGLVEPSDKLEVVGAISASSGSGFKLGNSNQTAIGKWYSASGVNFLEGDSTRSFQIGSVTNGVNVRFDNANNRVGIGTTSPDAKLEVNDDGSGLVFLGSNLAGNSAIINLETKLITDNVVGKAAMQSTRSANGAADLIFSTSMNGSLTEKLRIDQFGDVGINVTNPTQKLHVDGSIRVEGGYYDSGGSNGTSGQVLSSTGSETAWVDAASGGGGKFVDGTDPLDAVYTTGNVGIGTSAPQATLDVTGTLYIDDDAEFNSIVEINENLSVSEDIDVGGDIGIGTALLRSQQNTDVDTGTETVANVAIATYTAAFFDFVIKNGTNVRSGTVYACHDGTNVEFTETSTNDLGDTSDVKLSVDISGATMRLLAIATSDNWSVKSFVRAI